MVGKTNTPEWGAGSHTFNPVFGATRNAWDTSRARRGLEWRRGRRTGLPDGGDRRRERSRGLAAQPGGLERRARLAADPGLVPHGPSEAPWIPFAVRGPDGTHRRRLALLLGAMAGRHARDPLSARAARVDVTAPFADVSGRRVAWSPSLGGLPSTARARLPGGGAPVARCGRPRRE